MDANREMIIGLVNVVASLITKLDKDNIVNLQDIVTELQGTAIANRAQGNSMRADAYCAIADHILGFTPDKDR